MTTAAALPMEFSACGPLTGEARLPGDKSISHRALMLAALAVGRSRISGLSTGGDVASTAAALRAMGVGIGAAGDLVEVDGVGVGGLLQPAQALDMGNSGTSARLLAGLVASQKITAVFTGDASLCRRPMDRVIRPLAAMGAEFVASPGGRLPLLVRGAAPALARSFELRVASAQVKSALLLAGLNASGVTRVVEAAPTRDHSERMLERFGAEIEADGREIRLRGEAELRPQAIRIPGDPSSAAFLAVAALVVPGSEVRMRGVGVNPMRMGLFRMLEEMGGDLSITGQRIVGGEPVADISVRHSPLRAVDVPPALAPSMIDEFPIFFVAAAFASGRSRARGLSELRVKESDRIAAMAEGLAALGVRVGTSDDGLEIDGSAGAPLAGGAAIGSALDHRIAMSFAVAGLHCRRPVRIDDMSPVATSFPAFMEQLRGLIGQVGRREER